MSVKVLRSTLFLTAVLAVESVSAIVRFPVSLAKSKKNMLLTTMPVLSAEPVKRPAQFTQ